MQLHTTAIYFLPFLSTFCVCTIFLFQTYNLFIEKYIKMADSGENYLVVRFVLPKGRTEVTVTEALAQAFDQSKGAGLAAIWVQEQEVLNISPTETVIYLHRAESSS